MVEELDEAQQFFFYKMPILVAQAIYRRCRQNGETYLSELDVDSSVPNLVSYRQRLEELGLIGSEDTGWRREIQLTEKGETVIPVLVEASEALKSVPSK
jgi:predicted methyltransferase